MAMDKCSVLLFLTIILGIVAGQEYRGLNNIECQTSCQKPSSDSNRILTEWNASIDACERGCRFYTIEHFLHTSEDNILNMCYNSCTMAYNETSTRNVACMVGCQHHHELESQPNPPMSDIVDNKLEGDVEEENKSSIHFLTPILQVRRVVAQVVGGFRLLKSTVMTYFLQDDNTLLAVQSRPQIIVEVAEPKETPEEVLQRDEASKDNRFLEKDAFGLLNNNQYEYNQQTSDTGVGGGVTRVMVTRRRYAFLLHLMLVLSAASLAMLGLSYCIAAARLQRRKTLKAGGLQKVFQHEPLKLVRPEDLTKLTLMEEEEAPQLPKKHDLALTHAEV